jgi:hypothetical protein
VLDAGTVRRTGLLIGGWAVATVLALLCGLLGVRAIADTVTKSRPASLSPASIRTALEKTRAATSSSESETESPESSENADQLSSSSAVEPPRSTTTTVGASPPAPVGDAGSTASVEPASAPIDRTYQLIGGSVGVRFEDSAAHLLWAQPNAGYSVEIGSGDDSTVDVRFREINGDHESRLKAYWNNGPQQEIEEKND